MKRLTTILISSVIVLAITSGTFAGLYIAQVGNNDYTKLSESKITYDDIWILPFQPLSDTGMMIRTKISSVLSLESVYLCYTTSNVFSEENKIAVTMNFTEYGFWEKWIGYFEEGTDVRYYIVTEDNSGHSEVSEYQRVHVPVIDYSDVFSINESFSDVATITLDIPLVGSYIITEKNNDTNNLFMSIQHTFENPLEYYEFAFETYFHVSTNCTLGFTIVTRSGYQTLSKTTLFGVGDCQYFLSGWYNLAYYFGVDAIEDYVTFIIFTY